MEFRRGDQVSHKLTGRRGVATSDMYESPSGPRVFVAWDDSTQRVPRSSLAKNLHNWSRKQGA